VNIAETVNILGSKKKSEPDKTDSKPKKVNDEIEDILRTQFNINKAVQKDELKSAERFTENKGGNQLVLANS
jgi:hypothetical protein